MICRMKFDKGVSERDQTQQARKVIQVKESFSLHLPGEKGTGGRPRIREDIKPPPQYQLIDLFDANEEVLF